MFEICELNSGKKCAFCAISEFPEPETKWCGKVLEKVDNLKKYIKLYQRKKLKLKLDKKTLELVKDYVQKDNINHIVTDSI